MSDYVGRKTAEIISILKQEQAGSRKSEPEIGRTTIAALWLKRATAIGLIASAMPHYYLSITGGWIAVLSAAAFFALRQARRPPVRRFGSGTAALLVVSLLSGCAPALYENTGRADLLQFCREQILEGNTCRYGEDHGLRILGIVLNEADPSAARKKADITRAAGVQQRNGHGLIAVDQVVVYGS